MGDKTEKLLSTLKLQPVVPVLIVEDAKTAVPLARALVAGGLKAIEITLRTDAALEAVRLVAQEVEGAVVGAGSALLLLSGLDIVTAFSAVVATVNNIGPGLGLVGPSSNYGVLNGFQTWVLSFAMLLGRLELLTVLVLFTGHFWRK